MSDTTTKTTEPTVWRLANDAGVAGPDSVTSPGADWLRLVYGSALEIAEQIRDNGWTVSAMIEDGDGLDLVTESADSVVPIYTHNLWEVFVDLAAYTEEIEDYEIVDNLNHAASVALYLIAERLISVTLDEIAANEDETTA